MKSIISNKKQCLICRSTYNLHRHHIYEGAARRWKSEEDGEWVWLCIYHHTGSNYAVHTNHELDLKLKKYGQKKWEELYGNREDFIKRYGKNYL